jgi:two-component system LytT family response regulator
MIKAIVVDDERPSREALCNYLNEFCPSVEVLGRASSLNSAYKIITKLKPDVVFLDIEMPDGSGFDLLKRFERIDFRIIFITAYSEYAVEAFRFNALDYLLKPLKIDELQAAVNKVNDEIITKTNDQNIKTLINAIFSPPGFQQSISIPNRDGFDIIKLKDIIMCEADGYNTYFYLIDKRKIRSSKNMKHYENILKDFGFLRVHHSWLVNLIFIESYSNQEEILLYDKYRCPLGHVYKQAFLEKLKRLK